MAGVVFVALATWAIVLWTYFLWSRRLYYKAAWQLPGPQGLPFIGIALNMMYPEVFLKYMEREAKKYTSPFVSWMGTDCFLFVNDPETVETIFNSPHCTNKGKFYRFLASAIGDGLFTSSSPRWNKHRRLINPAFSRQIIYDFLPIFNAESDVLLGKLAPVGRQNAKLEIYQVLKKSVLEAACQTTMGLKMNFQQNSSAAIFDAYNGITEVCMLRALSPWLYPDILYRRSALFNRQQRSLNVLLSFAENLLQRGGKSNITKQTRLGSNNAAGSESETGVSSDSNANRKTNTDQEDTATAGIRKSKAIFVEQVRSYVEQGQLSWDDVRDEANVIIAATFETTSTALYLVCLCLAMNPDYQEKLYNELVSIFPVEFGAESTQQITNAHLDAMPYTEMVINEAMRLYSPVPIVLRSVSADIHLNNGVLVPQGTQVAIDIFNMQRSESVWGPQAKFFCPEQHFGSQAPPHHPFAFIPFTKGLRMCIGYRYALLLMKIFIAKIFRNYRIVTQAKEKDLLVKGTVSLKLSEYPLCELVPRSEKSDGIV